MAFAKYTYIKSLHGREFPSDLHYRVLVTLLDYADKNGLGAHPGNVKLGADCRCHPDSVKRCLRWLTGKGYVIRDHRGSRQGGASIYRFPDQAPNGTGVTPLGGNQKGTATAQKGTDGTVSPGSKGDRYAPPSIKDLSRGSDPKGSRPHQEDPWGSVPEQELRSDGLKATGNSSRDSVSHVGMGLSSERPTRKENVGGRVDDVASGELVVGLQLGETLSTSDEADYWNAVVLSDDDYDLPSDSIEANSYVDIPFDELEPEPPW